MLLTTTNLENYAKKYLNVPYVDFNGIDLRTTKMILKVLKEAYERYPLLYHTLLVIGKLDYLNDYLNLSSCSDKNYWYNWLLNNKPNTIKNIQNSSLVTTRVFDYKNGNYFMGLGLLPFLEKYNFEELQELIKNDYGSIKHTEVPENIVWHEVGHMLDFTMEISSSPKLANIIFGHDIATEVSLYATKDNQELVAESFAEYIIELKLNQLKPGLIKDIGTLIDKTYLKFARNIYLRKSFLAKDKYALKRKGVLK